MSTATRPRTLSLNTDDRWELVSGYADLFLVEPQGTRLYLLRVEAPATVFGLGPADSARTLMMVPGSETTLHLVTDPSPQSLPAMERWVSCLTASVATRSFPARVDRLRAGTISSMDRKTVSAQGIVVWVRPLFGSARFLGEKNLLVRSGTLFPLAPSAWLEPEETMQFEAATLDQVRGGAIDADLLREFHRAVQALWNANAGRRSEADRLRAERQSVANRARMGTALQQLAAPASGNAVPVDVGVADPWLAACRRLGAVLQIHFQAGASTFAGDPAGLEAANPVAAIASASVVRYRRVLLTGTWWCRDHGPLLGQRTVDKSPVALLWTDGGYSLHAEAAARRVNAELAAELEPFATFFYRAFPDGRVAPKDLVAFALLGCGPELRGLLLVSLCTAVLAMALPVVTGHVFDKIIPGARLGQLNLVASLLVLVALCSALFELTRGAILLRLEGRMDASLQAALWSRLLDLPPSFFRDFSAGDLAMRGLGVQAMREVLTGSVVTSMLSGVFSLVSFGVLFFYNVHLALIALALTAVAFIFVTACGYRQLRSQRQLATIQGQLSGLSLQVMNGIAKIRIAAAESRAFLAWSRLFSAQTREQLQARRVSNWVATFNALWMPLCIAVVFASYLQSLTGPDVAKAQLTTGDFVAFLSAFVTMLGGCLGFSSAWIGVLSVAPTLERARPIFETLPESRQGRTHPGTLTGAIGVTGVMFRYRMDGPLVLRNVSMNFLPGEFIGLVGSSGSGKSSLLRLLLGFEQSERGVISFDGKDLASLDPQAVRQQIGVVLQSGRIAAGSIFGNITGSLAATMDDAWDAARMAGFDADILAMPMGMQTVIGEGGGTLSGGQRQRMLIARALLRKPRILFFDEATSALDNETQAIVSRSLEALEATRVVIAHRLSTIERADRIYVMQRGEVVQQGSFRELASEIDGPFAELAKRQML